MLKSPQPQRNAATTETSQARATLLVTELVQFVHNAGFILVLRESGANFIRSTITANTLTVGSYKIIPTPVQVHVTILLLYLYPKGYLFSCFLGNLPERVFAMPSALALFVKQRRKLLHLSQPELAAKAGVGLRFVRELEQGKPTLRLDKFNQVLRLFGHELAPAPLDRALPPAPHEKS